VERLIFHRAAARIDGIVPCSIINSKQLSSEQALATDELIEIVRSYLK